MSLTPALFTSAAADGPDATKLRPSNWNRVTGLLTTLLGGADATGSLFVKNGGGDGAGWLAPGAAGTVFGGTGTTPAFTATPSVTSLTLSTPLAVGSGGTGTATAFTIGSVVFAGTSGVYAQDNANFFYDDTNNRLGIGTATPSAKLHPLGTTEQLRIGYDAANYVSLTVDASGALTLDAVGASAGFSFSDAVAIPGAGASSLRLGAGALAAGTQSVALGTSASAPGNLSVVVGYNSSTVAGASGQGAVAIGYQVQNVGGDCTVIGYQARANGTTSTAIGSGADGGSRTGSSDNVALGDDAKVRDDLAVANLTGVVIVGRQATSQSTNSVVVGFTADIGKSAGSSVAIGADTQIPDNFSDAIVIGRSAAATAASQCVIGSTAAPIRNFYFGSGVTAASPLTAKFNQANASGTNISTSDWEFNAGRSTGTGTGGKFVFQTTMAGSSGASLNSLATRLTVESSSQTGITGLLPDGYSGSGLSIGADISNSAASSGAGAFSGPASIVGNVGLRSRSNHSGINGDNVAVYAVGSGARRNVGVVGDATTTQANESVAASVGIYGAALRAHASAIQVGGYFTLLGSAPTLTSAALVADNGAETSPIFVARDNGTAVFTVADGGNVGIGTATFGTSAVGVLGLANGTEPSTSPADMVQIYSVDLSAGNATLGLRTETAVVTESVTSDRTLSVRINGTTYKICLKA
jgi:trimeric autotransporter adhesin